MAIPATMRYVAITQPGAPDVMHVADGPVPQPRRDEVLIEVGYAGVNRPDCAQRAGTYPPPPDASPVLGLEVAGRIVARGADVTSWNIGDDVCALTPGGGYAEYCATPAAWCLPVPAGWSLEQAAGLPENYFTVWNNVFDRAKLARGEWFLVHGGTSGIGLAAIQLAKALRRDGRDDRRQRRQDGVLPQDGRRPRDQLPDAGLRRGSEADHRQARRRRDPRHGRR